MSSRPSYRPLFDGLKLAAREVGGVQIQNAGTICGNLCNASPAADGMPNLLAMDAVVELASASGTRQVKVGDFVTGNRRTLRRPDELVTAILVPKPRHKARSGFVKLGARRYLVISIVMAAGVVETTADDNVAAARIAVGACSAVAQRLPALESALVGRRFDRALGGFCRARSPGAPVADRRHPRQRRLPQRCGGDDGAAPADSDCRVEPMNAPGPNLSFTVNGAAVAVSTDPRRRLADVLREDLGLIGTKVGCNAGDCGACTVLLDGRQVCACLVPVGQVGGPRRRDRRRPGARRRTQPDLQQAFLRHGAAQCGICTPGMLMAASDLLARNAAPDRSASARRAGRRAVPLHRLPQDRRGGAGCRGARRP